LLPTGNETDTIDGVEVTLIDNGMPCVVMSAEEMGITGHETPEELEANDVLRKKLESIRLKAGPMMNLGDVAEKSVPKMTMVSPATHGGCVSTRTFIPHRCHKAIGVLGAVSVGTACLLKSGPAALIAEIPGGNPKTLSVEHPTGEFSVVATLDDKRRYRIGRSAAHGTQAVRRGHLRIDTLPRSSRFRHLHIVASAGHVHGED
jgi:4-oxalomesaconate tautomerase